MLKKIGIITLGYGKPRYIEMAKTLARSLKLHSPNISRAIVTDRTEEKEILELFDIVIPFNKDYGSNLRQKLYINEYTPYTKTLFIDSDSIVVKDIYFIFEELEGRSFTVPGERLLSFGDQDNFIEDVDFILKKFNLTALPKFNGGVYYFDDSECATEIFTTAQSILKDCHNLPFSQFRNDGPSEEPLFAIAMAVHNQTMFNDAGRFMRTPIGITGKLEIDVLKGKSRFKKYQNIVSPAIVHFAGDWAETYIYYREALKLTEQYPLVKLIALLKVLLQAPKKFFAKH
ncbi:MAG TPA: hypothetical protein V6D25_10845 [Leptolyngbyaceae cyanobacterium]